MRCLYYSLLARVPPNIQVCPSMVRAALPSQSLLLLCCRPCFRYESRDMKIMLLCACSRRCEDVSEGLLNPVQRRSVFKECLKCSRRFIQSLKLHQNRRRFHTEFYGDSGNTDKQGSTRWSGSKKLVGWRPSLFGWRPLLLVARS